MKKKFEVIMLIPIIFSIVGITLLITGCFSLSYAKKAKATTVPVEATITDIVITKSHSTSSKNRTSSTSHSVYVDYEYNGKTYGKVHLGYYTSSMYVGGPATVYVDPANPGKIKNVNGAYIASFITIPMGVVFILVSSIILVVFRKGSKEKQEILTNGRSIYAKITQITVNRNVRINGRHPYRITCAYVDDYTGVTQEFVSASIFEDPTYRYHVGDDIEVKYLGSFDKYCVVVNL